MNEFKKLLRDQKEALREKFIWLVGMQERSKNPAMWNFIIRATYAQFKGIKIGYI